MSAQVALVAGASGVVGRGLVEYLSYLDGWEVIGLSRRALDDVPGRVRSLSVDLCNPDDCRAKLPSMGTFDEMSSRTKPNFYLSNLILMSLN